jgi:hypothetical protein
MITFLVVGRNDGFGLNLAKRTAISLNYFASLCEDDDDEIIYVDCNTIDGEVTLTESISDTLTPAARRRIKTFRISGEQMYGAIGQTPMPFSDELSRNVGIRRSNPNNPWILSTNCDLILKPIFGSLHNVLKRLKPQFYLCPRLGIPYEQWQRFDRANLPSISDACDQILLSGKRYPPELPCAWQRFGSIGDFQLAPRWQWFEIEGCEQGMNLWGHSDVNNAKRLSILNNNPRTPDLGGELVLFHLDHNIQKAVSANADTIAHNDTKKWVDDVTSYKSSNEDGWGLVDIDLPSPAMQNDEHLISNHIVQLKRFTALKIKIASVLSCSASKIINHLNR